MSSEQSSSCSESKEKKPRRRPIPVMDPVLKVKTKSKQIVINLSMTRYDVIADVADQLQWRIQYNAKKGDWDILWVDQMIEPDTLIKMHFFQKISHFPGIHVLARKNLLGMSLMEMNKKFPEGYNFFPKTYLLPADYPVFRQQVEKGQKKCYIVKPEADCQGRGIFLTFKTDEVENGKHYVVQEYIENPFLVQGLKFDFRVYVLLCGTNPMRLYVYEEGLARFATQKYTPPTKSNLKKTYMHLTNYAINKKNPKYIYNHSAKNMATGHKRSLTSILAEMKRRGFNVQALKEKIDDVLIKTIILGQPLVSHQYKFSQPDDQYKNMCFHILGVDIMIDQLLNPIVLEVNHTPSFATDTPLDYFIKFNLIKDTLVLLNVNQETKKQLIKKTNAYQRERVTNAKRLIQTEQQKEKIQQCQLKRDSYENEHLGRYRKAYPVNDQEKMKEYEEYLRFADKSYFSENNFIRSQIESEKDKDKEKQKTASKKSLAKKKSGSIQSPTIQKSKKHFSLSDKQLGDQKFKNSSLEMFKKQIRTSSLLNHPKMGVSSCVPISAHMSVPMNGMDSRANLGNQYIKIAKSIGQVDKVEDPKPSCNRISLVRNLPKIEQISPVKNSTIESNRSKYIGLRKKKISDGREQKKKQSIKGGKTQTLPGAFLTPKVMKFHNYDDDQQEQKTERVFYLGSEYGNSVGF